MNPEAQILDEFKWALRHGREVNKRIVDQIMRPTNVDWFTSWCAARILRAASVLALNMPTEVIDAMDAGTRKTLKYIQHTEPVEIGQLASDAEIATQITESIVKAKVFAEKIAELEIRQSAPKRRDMIKLFVCSTMIEMMACIECRTHGQAEEKKINAMIDDSFSFVAHGRLVDLVLNTTKLATA